MFHMKQFCHELSKYNQVHRLIGNVSCETLLAESHAAIKNSAAELSQYQTMIDVGAGAGILGFAWIESSLSRQSVLLEPDKKALGFLHSFFAGEKRARVADGRLETFDLKVLGDFAKDESKIFLAARAFSSNDSLEALYKKSGLILPLFVFEERGGKYFLAKKF